MGMQPMIGDAVFYVKRSSEKVISVTASYVDDLFKARNTEIEKNSKTTLKMFESKPKI